MSSRAAASPRERSQSLERAADRSTLGGAKGGTRTPTGVTRRNLNPVRLPIPPLSRAAENGAVYHSGIRNRGSGISARRRANRPPIPDPRCLIPDGRRPLRELPRRLPARARAAASGGRRRVPVRARRRRSRRRGRRAGRTRDSRRSTRSSGRSMRSSAARRRRLPRSPRSRPPCARTRCRWRRFRALLSAFRQDVTTTRYATRRDAARLLRALGQPGGPDHARPVRRRRRGRAPRERRHLHGPAARELLAGRRDRRGQGSHLRARGGPRAVRGSCAGRRSPGAPAPAGRR